MRIKTILMFLATFSFSLFLIGCDADKSFFLESSEIIYDDTTIHTIALFNDNKVLVFTDPDTKVQYLIFNGYRKGGITPRLDANCNLIIASDDDRGDFHAS